MALDFASIASQKIADVERPPLAPQGTYRWAVTKLPAQDKIESDKGSWDTLTFVIVAKEALEDVDPDELAAYGDLKNNVQTLRFMFDKNDEVAFQRTLFQLRQFLENHLGVATPDDTIASALNASVGAEFLAVLSHRENKNAPGEFFANVNRTAPVA